MIKEKLLVVVLLFGLSVSMQARASGDDEIVDLTQVSKDNLEKKQQFEEKKSANTGVGIVSTILGAGAVATGTVFVVNSLSEKCSVLDKQGACTGSSLNARDFAIGTGVGVIGGAVLTYGLYKLFKSSPESSAKVGFGPESTKKKAKLEFKSASVNFDEKSKDFSGALKWSF